MIEKLIVSVNIFYDDIIARYSKCHNSVTSLNIFKAIFKKYDNNEIASYYKSINNDLINLIDKINVNNNDEFTVVVLNGMKIFKNVLDIEIEIYTNNDTKSMDELKRLSKQRSYWQNEFKKFDYHFRTAIK